MEHILQFAINIDDNAIINRVSEKAEAVVLNEIKTNIDKAIYRTAFNGRLTNDLQPWIYEEFNKFLENHKDEIIARASEKLADKLSRTKRVKEELDKILEVVTNE